MSRKVLMVGPVPFIYSGISKVAGYLIEAENNEYNIHYISTFAKKSSLHKIFIYLQGLFKILYYLMLSKPKVTHLHFSKGASIYRKLIILKLSHLFKVPVIVHSHSVVPQIKKDDKEIQMPDFFKEASKLSRKFISHFLKHADCIIVLSEAIKSCFLNITENKNIKILNNPVNCGEYIPRAKKRKQNKFVLFMGDFSKRKGIRDLIRAIPIVIDKFPFTKFILCGGEEKEIKNNIKECRIEKHIEIPGFISGKKKINLFDKSDIFVLPSYSEGLPIAILEAMSSGLPIISTPVGGIPDILVDKVNAMLVQPGDYNQLAKSLITLLSDDKLQHTMGEKNRKKVLEEFDTPKVINCLNSIYEKIANKSQESK